MPAAKDDYTINTDGTALFKIGGTNYRLRAPTIGQQEALDSAFVPIKAKNQEDLEALVEAIRQTPLEIRERNANAVVRPPDEQNAMLAERRRMVVDWWVDSVFRKLAERPLPDRMYDEDPEKAREARGDLPTFMGQAALANTMRDAWSGNLSAPGQP